MVTVLRVNATIDDLLNLTPGSEGTDKPVSVDPVILDHGPAD